MRRRIIYRPQPQLGRFRRIPFTPLSQEPPSPLKGIGTQVLDYLKFGKPITAPIKPIQTEVIIPRKTKNFIWSVVGAVGVGIVLYQVFK